MSADGLGALAGALTKAKADFAPVTRSKTVKVTTKTGLSYTFSYAPLDTILDAVGPALMKNGLAFVQLLDGGDLVTMLIHESGASLEGRTPLPAMTDIQSFGSAVTYLRRYAIQALLGIAAEEDDDGNRGSGNDAKPVRPARAAAPSEPAPLPRPRSTAPPALSEDEVGELLTQPEASTYCMAEDKSMDTGPCALKPGHDGPHRNRGGVWPQ
jgi:ERF superfamily